METSSMEIVTDRSISRRQVMALSGAALAAGAFSVAGVTRPASAQSPVPDLVDGDFAGLIDIGGRSLYLTCTGSGGPTVVLVTGYRDTSDIWSIDQLNPTDPRTMVLPSVAQFTRVCAYDRPGTATSLGDEDLIGRSDAIPQPRTVTEAADELHALVHAAGIETPFVLAAHSLGGAIARVYTSAYPEDVSGLVLIEAYSEFIEALMTPEQWQALVTFNVDYGTDTVNPIPGYGDMETIPYGSMNQELRDTAPLGDLPLAVMSHGVPFDIPTVPEAFTSAAEVEDFLTSANEQQATLAPDGRYWLAETSGHYVHQDQPELVIEAIRQVVTGVREPDTWTSLESCCAD